MFSLKKERRSERPSLFPLFGPLVALIFAFGLVQFLAASSDAEAGMFDGSTKSVAQTEASAGDVLTYTLNISHTGTVSTTNVMITDSLPAELTYVSDTLTVTPDIGSYAESNGVITWTGDVEAESTFSIQFAAQLTETVAGQTVTNTVQINDGGHVITRSAGTDIPFDLYMTLFFKPAQAPEISASTPTSGNSWTVSWSSNEPGITGYELQEAQDAAFDTASTSSLSGTSQNVTKNASYNNEYYYRVRSLHDGGQVSFWSDPVKVVGNYYDDFNSTDSNWAPVRRTTYLEETVARYGTGNEAGNLIVIVADRWDWLIASPLKEAPEPPYVIEYRARVHDASNLISGGPIIGGDWNGGACPEFGNVYKTTNCFNQFYNYNFIFYGPMKLLFERVDQLRWCPSCGGSPIKRLGGFSQEVDPVLSNGPSLDWHTYRIEVTNSGLKLFIDGNQRANFNDTTYINQPYFGVFASTDEYKPSIWFYDYFSVTRMD